MNEHDTERLSAYVDGDLGPEERKALEAHLRECHGCARTLREIQKVVAGAAMLPQVPPARDLWPEVESRLEPRSPDDVIPLPRRRRVAFTVPQLVAAGIALVVLSAGSMWMVVGGDDPVPVATQAAEDWSVTRVAFTDFDRTVSALEAEYLERSVDLDPETIRVVEENLAIIDRAILEAREALAADPSSGFLSSHLAGAMRRKADLLRRAAALAQTET